MFAVVAVISCTTLIRTRLQSELRCKAPCMSAWDIYYTTLLQLMAFCSAEHLIGRRRHFCYQLSVGLFLGEGSDVWAPFNLIKPEGFVFNV